MASDRLPPRVAAIRRAIETRLDFTGLRDGGEEEVIRYFRSRGQNGREMICRWQAVGMRAQESRQSAGVTARAEPDLASPDLDDWSAWGARPEPKPPPDDSDDRLPEDDGEVGVTTEQRLCPDCGGTGFDESGATCSRCNGTGRVPVDDDEEEDEEAASFYGRIEDE